MWTWFSDPFGADAANANPSGAGTFAYNLRLPGQVFDGEVAGPMLVGPVRGELRRPGRL